MQSCCALDAWGPDGLWGDRSGPTKGKGSSNKGKTQSRFPRHTQGVRCKLSIFFRISYSKRKLHFSSVQEELGRGWCLFTLLSRIRKLTRWVFSSLVSAWNHWAAWKMLTASHPRDSEVIHWLVWRAHIPRWLQLAPRELESSVTCGSRSLDHFRYSCGKYVLFTDGRQRDNSKFPYPHKPYPPLKELSLISILYWARRVVFNIPIEYSPTRLQLSQVLDSRHPTIFWQAAMWLSDLCIWTKI